MASRKVEIRRRAQRDTANNLFHYWVLYDPVLNQTFGRRHGTDIEAQLAADKENKRLESWDQEVETRRLSQVMARSQLRH